MNIGELYVSLFVKDDGFRAKMEAAKRSMDVAAGAAGKLGSAAAATSNMWARLGLDAQKAASKVEAAADKSARAYERQLAAHQRLIVHGSKLGSSLGAGRIFTNASGDWGAASKSAPVLTALARRSRSAGDMAIDNLRDDLAMRGGSGRTPMKGNWQLAHMMGQRGASNREYVMGENTDWGGGKPPPKKPGFFSRFGGGGSGGGGKSGGGGGYSSRFGPLGEASAFRRVILGAGIFQGAQWFGELADSYTNMQMRLEGLTGSQEKASETFEKLRGVAKLTKSDLESTTEGYVRIRYATQDMNMSEEDTIKLVTNLNTLLATSGASASEARSGMMQLTQAFAKGKLDGDEFRSIAENMPNVLKVLAKSLNMTEGELRKLSADKKKGGITRKMLAEALINVKGLQEPVETFGNTWVQFKNDMVVTAGRLAANKDLVHAFAVILKLLADTLILVAKVLAPVISGIGEFIQGLKDGKTWAYALAAVLSALLIPQVVSLVTWLLKIPAALKGLALSKIGGIGADIASVGAAYGAGGGGAAKGAAGVAGAAKKGGIFNALKRGVGAGAAFLGGPVGWGIAGTLAFNEIMDEIAPSDGAMWNYAQQQLGGASAGAGKSVHIGEINVQIQAQDTSDALQMTEEAIQNRVRQAAAAFGG